MKLIFTILFLSWANCYATTYYVSNSGSDVASGTSQVTAWQSVSKINSLQSSFVAGDSILFQSGNTWNERLVITSSGTQSNPIYVGSYGSGTPPLITGFQSLTGFTNVGNIWTGTATNASNSLNLILINGNTASLARYPNTGYLTFTSVSGDSSITGTLTGTPSYVGKQIVVRTASWVLDRSIVTAQVGGKLTMFPKLTYTPGNGGNGYFFQNDSSFLDTLNEWTFDSVSKRINVYQTSLPTVQYSTIDTLVWIKGSWLTFNGINLTGANKKLFQIDTCRGVTIQNCSLNYSGGFGVMALKSSLLNINNNSIQNCYSGGGYTGQPSSYTPTVNTCDSMSITNNYIKNIGIYAGMGGSGNGQYFGFAGVGVRPVFTGNRLDSIGYLGVSLAGFKTVISNNIISNFCFIKNDGGGIYMGIGSYLPTAFSDSSSITSNIVYNALDAPLGSINFGSAYGIYLDDFSRYINVDSNTIYNCQTGFFIHNSSYIKFRNNNLYNNLIYGVQFAGLSSSSADSLYLTNNSYYSGTQQTLFNFGSSATVLPYFGTLDSNYYANPWGDAQSFSTNSGYKNLSQWQYYSGKDANSFNVPTGVNKYPVLFLVNTLPVSQTFRVLGTYSAVDGVSYTNYVNILPYQSLTLIKATTNTGTAFPIPSSLPVFISKIIQQ